MGTISTVPGRRTTARTQAHLIAGYPIGVLCPVTKYGISVTAESSSHRVWHNTLALASIDGIQSMDADTRIKCCDCERLVASLTRKLKLFIYKIVRTIIYRDIGLKLYQSNAAWNIKRLILG